MPSLAPGSYRVEWRIVSADGHPVSGALTFSIGEPSQGAAVPGDEPELAGTLD